LSTVGFGTSLCAREISRSINDHRAQSMSEMNTTYSLFDVLTRMVSSMLPVGHCKSGNIRFCWTDGWMHQLRTHSDASPQYATIVGTFSIHTSISALNEWRRTPFI
jgi:hypothetical protein